jgi:hypothetical protein
MENFLTDLFLILLVFWAGYVWGKHVTVMRMLDNIINNPDNLARAIKDIKAIQEDKEDSQEEGQLVVERHDDQIYLYDKENHEFLAQGSSLQEALDHVDKRFPNRKYQGHLTKEQADALGIKP